MRPLLFFILILLFHNSVAQSPMQDSIAAEKLLLQATENPDKAVEYCKEAIVLFQKANIWASAFYAERRLASAYAKMRDFAQAETIYLNILKELPKRLKLPHNAEGKTYSALGELYRSGLHQSDKAKEYLQKAIDWYLTNEGEFSSSILGTYSNIGLLYLFDLHAYQTAMDYFMKALAVSLKHESEYSPNVAGLYNKIATTYRYQGNPDKAIEYFRKSILICERKPAENAYSLQSSYNNLGAVFMDMGMADKAIASYEKSLQIHQKNKLPINELYLLAKMNIGDSYSILGQYPEALKQYKIAYTETQKAYGNKDGNLAHLCNNIAFAFFRCNEPDSALVYAQKGVLANVVGFDEQDFLKSPDLSKNQYLDGMELIYAFINKTEALGVLYQENKELAYLECGYQTLQNAMEVFHKLESNSESANDKMYLLKNMQHVFQAGINICETLYQESGKKSYQNNAFAITESNKAALLRQSLHEDNAKEFGGIPDSLLQLEQEIKMQLAQYENQWVKAEISQNKNGAAVLGEKIYEEKKRAQKLQLRFEKEFPDYFQLKYNKKSPEIKNLQALLPANAALISYAWNKEKCFIFVIQKDSFKITQKTLPQLSMQVDSLFDLLYSHTLAQKNPDLYLELYNRYGHGLYQQLIGSLALPKSIQQLIIIPDRSLHYIPFEALLKTPATTQKTYAEWDYLLHHYTIHYSYSASLFEQLSQRTIKASNSNVLAFAPTYEGEKSVNATRSNSMRDLRKNLIPLSGVQEEVQRLEKSFQGQFFYGSNANESNFKKNIADFGILHLAMHGLMDSQAPSNSSLAFSENNDTIEDNFLHAYEINNLKINAQLVVLSACETGHGKFESGEGVMSLARSFMYAGANSVVATLWQVNDASTAMLMEYFYQNINKKMDKAEALRQAKISYLQNAKGLAAHPNFWAAPILLGDNKAIVIENKTNWLLWSGIGGCGVLAVLFWRRRRVD